MTIQEFAKQHRLKTQREDCGDFLEVLVPGKQGQIYEWSLDGSKFAVMFMPPKTVTEPSGKWCPKRWGSFRRAAQVIGMTILQNGDSEGCLRFDPTNSEQVKLALRIAGIRPKRRVSPEQVARLAKIGFKAQNSGLMHTVEALDKLQNGGYPAVSGR